MRTTTIYAVILGIVAFATAEAATLVVPSQYPTIQDAINNASPGDQILVHGGRYSRIIVDRPLTIIGDPMPTIDNTNPSAFPGSPAILLQGPGSGVVRFVRIRATGKTDGGWISATGCGILGGGFAELHVEDSVIEAAEWYFLSGTGTGKPGISVSVPYVEIVRSTVTGSRSNTDTCDYGSPKSGDGVYAPTSTVVAVDSSIRGGDGADLCFSMGSWPVPLSLAGGAGGDGVVCDRLFEGGALSDIAGGKGLDIVTWWPGGGLVVIGQAPDGVPYVVNTLIPLGATLFSTGPLVMGKSALIGWLPPANPVSFLLLSTPIQPTAAAGAGWLFVDPATLFLIDVTHSTDVVAPVPSIPALLGMRVAIQFWNQIGPLSNPYISTIQQ